MFDYYTKIQQIVRSNEDSAEQKAVALYEILTKIRGICGKSLDLSHGQFISTDLQNTLAGEIAEHLKEAIVASGEEGINDFKLQIVQYFYGNEELKIKGLGDLFNFSQLEDKGEEYDKIAVNRLYKNWILYNNTDEIQWDKLLGDTI